eukprot:CAMPEP_0172753382 /NCGR_PEP_ID=MMETSP1074-20121228/155840_1 /TAXON_ID=2916 /ORGANISM="Ceratium fusus, Strain PA161109" /LENGTH=152 /DNA_ID=CAMNT_0013586047 /DNA_START=586 /DNA_END=1045 /DNA_ORIENTATION=+
MQPLLCPSPTLTDFQGASQQQPKSLLTRQAAIATAVCMHLSHKYIQVFVKHVFWKLRNTEMKASSMMPVGRRRLVLCHCSKRFSWQYLSSSIDCASLQVWPDDAICTRWSYNAGNSTKDDKEQGEPSDVISKTIGQSWVQDKPCSNCKGNSP